MLNNGSKGDSVWLPYTPTRESKGVILFVYRNKTTFDLVYFNNSAEGISGPEKNVFGIKEKRRPFIIEKIQLKEKKEKKIFFQTFFQDFDSLERAFDAIYDTAHEQGGSRVSDWDEQNSFHQPFSTLLSESGSWRCIIKALRNRSGSSGWRSFLL